MKADKNTVIGFVLLAVLFFGYFWYNNKMQTAYLAEKKRIEDSTAIADKRLKDSIAKIEDAKLTPEQKAQAKLEAAKADSLKKAAEAGAFSKAAVGKEVLSVIDNSVMKITFTNVGGRVKYVELKNYKSFDSSLVKLGSEEDALGYRINGGNNALFTAQLPFAVSEVTTKADGSKSISFSLKDSSGKGVIHEFTVRPNDYLIDWNVHFDASNLLQDGMMNLSWQSTTQQHEKSASYERQQMSNICFVEDDDFDYIMSKTEHKFEKPTQWMSIVQQFFNTTLIAKSTFSTGQVNWVREPVDSSRKLAKIDASFQLKVPAGDKASVPFQLYYGPNDYKILKKQPAKDMDKIVNLGRDMYSFVRPINQYIIKPVFDFFASLIANYGWVILLLTLFIRLITAPLMYGSYMSSAKMKVLRPELDTLKKKFGSDQQGYAMEQMKLFREAGVNPLGGCIPALLQIPIFFALYSFFNSNIALRGQPFLWSDDLSAFDAFISWKTEIWAIGSHISLFTLTAVITSFLISIYNMSMTPTQDNPALKYMPYIFPFILFFVFNKLPSALTWYYTVSNIITLLLQFVIQTYIIDHDKVLAKIELKRKSPKAKTKSKWQERYEQVMESQKKMQELKNKNQNKK